jgi:hypothetical protein
MPLRENNVPDIEVKRFIRKVLGCSCPDEVFEHMEIRFAPEDAEEALFQIVAGNRLLVRAYRLVSAEAIGEALPRWRDTGMAARDARGLNRLRLVLVADSPADAERRARQAFDAGLPADAKAHLHVISPSALEGLFLVPC